MFANVEFSVLAWGLYLVFALAVALGWAATQGPRFVLRPREVLVRGLVRARPVRYADVARITHHRYLGYKHFTGHRFATPCDRYVAWDAEGEKLFEIREAVQGRDDLAELLRERTGSAPIEIFHRRPPKRALLA